MKKQDEMTASDSTPRRHWADRVADQVEADGRPPVLSTGISPSGDFHIGHVREVLTADAVYRVLVERGIETRFNYVADNFDPLRKVYPFLDQAVYADLVGRPLSEIRCPCDEHPSYGDHYLEPFLRALDDLRVDVELERADEMYKSGRMTPYIVQALEQRDRIASILAELTGKEVADDWSPFNPLCNACGRIAGTRLLSFSEKDETVEYRCDCGVTGEVPMAGGGKLIWRVDWPARWKMLGVTVEPFGKDHATKGGSFDTGVRVIREVFGGEPPLAIPYEWIGLSGKGDMSSSKGNVLSIGSVLEVVPPEALRYLVMRERPERRIKFDPGQPLLRLVDELDDATTAGRDERAVELSQASGFHAVGVPYQHLVVVAQLVGFDADRAVEVLHRSGYPEADRDAVASRMGYAHNWLEGFAPDSIRFTVQPRLPDEAAELDDAQRGFLGRLADGLEAGMDGQQIHDLIFRIAGDFPGTKPPRLFEAIYLSLLGRSRGPRAGWFLALLGPEFTTRRFREAAGGSA